MIKSQKSYTPIRHTQDFILVGNLLERKLPEYNRFHDPHLLSYFELKDRKSKQKSSSKPVFRIYVSKKNLTPIKPLRSQFKSPSKSSKTIKIKKARPISSEKFKEILIKFRASTSDNKIQLSTSAERI